MATKPLLLNETGETQAQHLDRIAGSLEQMAQQQDAELVESDDTEDIAEDADDEFRDNFLYKTPQSLTTEEKQQVRENIGAVAAETVLNKVDKGAPVADDGNYIFALDASNNPIRIPKATMFSLMADFIHANAEQQRKVTFGASNIQELQTSVGNNLYGATNAAGLASVVAGELKTKKYVFPHMIANGYDSIKISGYNEWLLVKVTQSCYANARVSYYLFDGNGSGLCYFFKESVLMGTLAPREHKVYNGTDRIYISGLSAGGIVTVDVYSYNFIKNIIIAGDSVSYIPSGVTEVPKSVI